MTKVKILNLPEKLKEKSKVPFLTILYMNDKNRILAKPIDIKKEEISNLHVTNRGKFISVIYGNKMST